MTGENQLPPNTCVYGRYNTHLLTPENQETELRLRELGWTRNDFAGQTVLDIGCNSGILSIFALQLGASHVKAVDPTQKSIETFSAVLQRHRALNVTLELADLSQLDPTENRSDIVLFMEVMHWAVDQGMTVQQVTERLWQMTRRTLFLEFPWSIHEPSIRAQTKLTEETYSASLIFEELSRAFANVKIVTFMHYFGILSAAKRVLVRATEPRPEYVVTARQPNMFSVFALGERSSNHIAPLISPTGAQFFKQFSPHSSLAQLQIDSATALISAIVDARPQCLVAPVAVEGRYIIENSGFRSSVFPLIARRRINMREFHSIPETELIAAAIHLRRDLRGVEIPPFLRSEESLRRSPGIDDERFDLSVITGQASPSPTLEEMLTAGMEAYDLEATEICHCDLQEGNVIIALDGSVHVVDLDGLAFGTAFTDGICAMIWAGASPEVVETTVAALESEEARHATLSDCGIAFIIMAHWFQAIVVVNTEEAKAHVLRARRGLFSLITWWERRAWARNRSPGAFPILNGNERSATPRI
jgi:SAM-dependent methyltransferase